MQPEGDVIVNVNESPLLIPMFHPVLGGVYKTTVFCATTKTLALRLNHP
jgi:hypothetical protein